MNRFTNKELKFIELILKGEKAGAAYVKAGYKAKTRAVADTEGWRLTRKPKIADVIDRANREALAKSGLTAELVVDGLKTEAFGLGPDTNPGARVKAFELLGKRLKLFGDDPPPVGKSELVIKVIGGEASMSDLLPAPPTDPNAEPGTTGPTNEATPTS